MADENTVLSGDCMERMKEIENESVDCIVTDPPYGMNYQSAWRTDKSKRHAKIANDSKPFIWWLAEAFRVLKPDCAMYCFADWRNSETFRMAIELAGFDVRSQGIWDREAHGMGDLRAQLAPQHDVIWFATKGQFTFPGSRPKSIFRSKRVSGCNLLHPNQKPVDLLEQLIISVTRENDIVLDPFAGSGSTLVAAKNVKRRYMGFEQEERYVAVSLDRLKQPDAILAKETL